MLLLNNNCELIVHAYLRYEIFKVCELVEKAFTEHELSKKQILSITAYNATNMIKIMQNFNVSDQVTQMTNLIINRDDTFAYENNKSSL